MNFPTAMSDNCNPLVSFLLIGYRLEPLIREAIAGAFAQTYSPMEIILSDDCSPDRTYAIMEEMAAAYRGPHKIILNRNPQNCGISGHINRLMELASGEWVVIANGDDISLPHRTQTLMRYAAAAGENIYSLFSGYEVINWEGAHLSFVTANNRAVGATHAWRRVSYTKFGRLLSGTSNDDEAMVFRSRLLGRAAFVPEALVKYRIHGSNLWSFDANRSNWWQPRAEARRKILYRLRSLTLLYAQYLQDLKQLPSTPETSRLLNEITPQYQFMAGVLAAFDPVASDAEPPARMAGRLQVRLHRFLLRLFPVYYTFLMRLQASRLHSLTAKLPNLLPTELPCADSMLALPPIARE